jgi:PKHD-type hydroxylase
MMKYKNYDYVAGQEAFLSSAEVELLQRYAGKLPAQPGNMGVDGATEDESLRKSVVKWIGNDPEVKWLNDKIFNMVRNVNEEFFHMDITSFEDLQHTTYKAGGGFYGVHMDTFINAFPQRKISFTIQLSDAVDYEGGQVKIYNKDIINPFIASKSKGSLVIFHSMMLHEVTPVTKGVRSSLVGWVSGPPMK